MLRRDAVLFKRGVIPALFLSLLLAVPSAAAGFSVLKSAAEGSARAEVVLVDYEDSLYSRIAISTVEAQSYIDSLLHIETAESEEAALSLLADGKCAAVIVLPEGYVNDISAGRKATGRIILSEAAAASAETVYSVAQFGERLLAAGQFGVFAGQHLIRAHDLPGDWEKNFLIKSNNGLMQAALSLFDSAVTTEVTAYDGTSLSITAYYAAAWLVLFFLLCGLFFPELYLTDDRPDMLTRLYALGVSPAGFFLGKWFWPFVFRVFLGVLLLIGLGRIIPLTLTPFAILLALLGLVFISLFVSLIAVLTASRSASFGLITALAAAGLFLAGGIVPRSMLAPALTEIGRFTPSGLAVSFFTPLFGGTADWTAMGIAALFTAALSMWTLRVLRLRPFRTGGDPE